MAKYNDYKDLPIYMIYALANDACFFGQYFYQREFTSREFNYVRESNLTIHGCGKMHPLCLDTLMKYGVIVKTRTETFHVYTKRDRWDTTVLSDMTDELWAMLPQSIRDELDVKREERKRCYYMINYDKSNELVIVRDLLNAMFN